MTRKDYIRIARALRESKPTHAARPNARSTWSRVARALAAELRDDNPHFAPARFYDAAGLGDDGYDDSERERGRMTDAHLRADTRDDAPHTVMSIGKLSVRYDGDEAGTYSLRLRGENSVQTLERGTSGQMIAALRARAGA